MKTKVFKTVLPFLVMILAIGLSFAVEANKVVQIGYFDDPLVPGIQEEMTYCHINNQDELCKSVNGFQLYNTKQLGAIEDNELKRNNP